MAEPDQMIWWALYSLRVFPTPDLEDLSSYCITYPWQSVNDRWLDRKGTINTHKRLNSLPNLVMSHYGNCWPIYWSVLLPKDLGDHSSRKLSLLAPVGLCITPKALVPTCHSVVSFVLYSPKFDYKFLRVKNSFTHLSTHCL